MARYTIVIEDTDTGHVKITSNPPAQGVIDRVKRRQFLTPCEEYAAEFFVIALKKSGAAGKIITPYKH